MQNVDIIVLFDVRQSQFLKLSIGSAAEHSLIENVYLNFVKLLSKWRILSVNCGERLNSHGLMCHKLNSDQNYTLRIIPYILYILAYYLYCIYCCAFLDFSNFLKINMRNPILLKISKYPDNFGSLRKYR